MTAVERVVDGADSEDAARAIADELAATAEARGERVRYGVVSHREWRNGAARTTSRYLVIESRPR